MAGITDKPFRQMLRQFSEAPIFTEMIGVETLVHHHAKTLKMLQLQDEKNIIVQLVGAKPESFVQAVPIVEDAGAIGIDINMGCPVKKLIQNYSGAELMRHVDLAKRLVEAVKQKTKLPVSVKTRLGWKDADELESFACALEEVGADRLEVHARTKMQGFSGHANWSVVGKNRESFNMPVIINGDIIDYTSAQQALRQSCASGVMIGRALLGRPWKLAEIESDHLVNPSMVNVVLDHFERLLSFYGHAGIFVARKHLAWYAKNKKNVAEWREKMYLEEDETRLKRMIIDFFGEDEQ